MRRLLLAILLLQLTACSTFGLYPVKLENDVLHEQVFAESYRRLAGYYIEPIKLDKIVPFGMGGLKMIDPQYAAAVTRTAGADDWAEWAEITLESISAAKARSPLIAAASPDDIYNAFYPALMSQLDGFSRYIPPMDAKLEDEMQSGYGGIGVTFERKNDQFVIMDTFIDSPAARAGLKAGQIIYALDGIDINALTPQEFANRVRGPVGQRVTLRVAKPGEAQRDVGVVRAQVIPTTVSLTMDRSVAVIRITRFMPGTVREFRHVAQQALSKRPIAVVLDLQHNPGGVLESATEIASLLVPKGLIASTSGRHRDALHVYNGDGADILNGLPLYVLQDGRSASAAEVLAAALADRGRATVIGSTSYGKGSVQNVSPLPHGGEIAVTWAKLVAPSGHSWVHQGVHPTACLRVGNPCPKVDDLGADALNYALTQARR